MTVRKLAQRSFVNGQYDRAAQNQESFSNPSIVASGLSCAKNVLSSDKGELRKRLGTKFIKELSGATVLVPYRKADDDDLVLAFSNNQLDVLEYNDGICDYYEPSTDTKISQVWTGNSTGGYTITINGTVGSRNNEAYQAFNDPVYDPSTYRTNGWYYNSYTSGTGMKILEDRFAVQLELPASSIIGKIAVNFAIGFDATNGEPAQGYMGYTNAVLQYSDDGINWTSVQSDIVSTVGNAPYYYVQKTNPPAVIHREYRIEYTVMSSVEKTAHTYWRIIFTQPISARGGTREVNPRLHLQFFTRTQSSYSAIGTNITNLKALKYSQSNRLLKITDGEHTPKNVTLSGSISCTDWTPANDSLLWNTWGNPKTCLYSMGRLWFSGFDAYPDTVIASKFNDESKFTPNSPAQYDDGLELVSNQIKSQIKNLAGGQNVVYCFSQDGISMIDGGSAGLIATNQNIEFNLKNRMPAGDSTPAYKDDVMLYSSSEGTKLYAIDYDLLIGRFQVADLAKYAKDITADKITELHYLNNESKLVYGLTESNKAFALLYEKGQFQGFFPLDFSGDVYDICTIKVGRDYKLLMVVYRNGHWYLEEKLDTGKYVDTSNLRLTADEKKWATYDNLQNNIALDCYQEYNEAIRQSSVLDNNILKTQADLLVGLHYMLEKEKDLAFVTIGSKETVSQTDNLYAWNASAQVITPKSISRTLTRNPEGDIPGYYAFALNSTPGTNWYYLVESPSETDTGYRIVGGEFQPIAAAQFYDRNPSRDTGGRYAWGNVQYPYYTDSETPNLGDKAYYSSGSGYSTITFVTPDLPESQKYTDTTTPSVNSIVFDDFDKPSGTVEAVDANTITINGREYTRNSDDDISRTLSEYHYEVEIIDKRGDSQDYEVIYPEFITFVPNLPQGTDIKVIADGRYFDDVSINQSGYVEMPARCYKAIYGINYEALAIIKIQTPYESMKSVIQADVSVIDTTHLEIGTSFSDTQYIEKIDDSSYYDLTKITMNDTYRLVLSDTPEMTKSVIFRSNMGVPFTMNAVEIYMNYSNIGGD